MRYPFIFTAGGTGGHIFPAISTAKILNLPVLFLTGRYGMEKTIFEKEKLNFKTLPLRGLSGVSFFKKFIRIPSVFLSLLISLYYILKINPEIIVGFGGYASFPALFWSRFLNIKYFLQEQNSIPGFVTRFFSKKAEAIFTGFPEIKLEGNLLFTGNPLREEFYEITQKEKISFPLNIFIIGGSQGSNFLDKTLLNIIPSLKGRPIKVIHQTRRENLNLLEKNYKEFEIDHMLFEFTEKPWIYYQQADLIICRAGALTVSEVISSGRCAIFIPFKGSAENHQYFNAKYLLDSNSAFLIEENDNTSANLLNLIKEIFEKPQILIEMGKKSKEKEKKDGLALIKRTLLQNLKGGKDAF